MSRIRGQLALAMEFHELDGSYLLRRSGRHRGASFACLTLVALSGCFDASGRKFDVHVKVPIFSHLQSQLELLHQNAQGRRPAKCFERSHRAQKHIFCQTRDFCAAPGLVSAWKGNVLSVVCFPDVPTGGGETVSPLLKSRAFSFNNDRYIGGGGIAPQALLLTTAATSTEEEGLHLRPFSSNCQRAHC